MDALRETEPVMRRVLGVAAAAVAAPFLFLTILFIPRYLYDRLQTGSHQQRLSGSEILSVLVTAEVNIFRIFWIPLLSACLICGGLAFLLERMGLRSRLLFMTGGALMSLTLMLGIIWEPTTPFDGDRLTVFVTLTGAAVIAGALGGWIYWRIALGQRPRETTGAS